MYLINLQLPLRSRAWRGQSSEEEVVITRHKPSGNKLKKKKKSLPTSPLRDSR